ncbi:uncharacterized protein ColSpa_03039 [Colletotrichum spaethianum]|uniref:Small secreted protein n=1 Tax=Colletotrichum spaethianum TaxID=700344 RepID=A0AA37LAQ4_9PEZI|nr:uncharacterized protein ColSpa_03039 [Colletotrichum spaethianum]GKT42858.1 hypothetical protein ColSpa_03039 [Colletotrichum spaethianum]
MRFTLALTTLVAVAMAAPFDSIVARKDELTAAIAALADENPADAEAAKGLLNRDLQLTQDEEDEEEDVFKRDIAAPQLADVEDEEDEEEDVFKRDVAATQLADVEDEEEEDVFKRDVAATQLADVEDEEEEDVFKRDIAAPQLADVEDEEEE